MNLLIHHPITLAIKPFTLKVFTGNRVLLLGELNARAFCLPNRPSSPAVILCFNSSTAESFFKYSSDKANFSIRCSVNKKGRNENRFRWLVLLSLWPMAMCGEAWTLWTPHLTGLPKRAEHSYQQQEGSCCDPVYLPLRLFLSLCWYSQGVC